MKALSFIHGFCVCREMDILLRMPVFQYLLSQGENSKIFFMLKSNPGNDHDYFLSHTIMWPGG